MPPIYESGRSVIFLHLRVIHPSSGRYIGSLRISSGDYGDRGLCHHILTSGKYRHLLQQDVPTAELWKKSLKKIPCPSIPVRGPEVGGIHAGFTGFQDLIPRSGIAPHEQSHRKLYFPLPALQPESRSSIKNFLI